MTELVINVSNIISPLCYSLIRIEPYDTCSFNCTYCYTQWYWSRKSGTLRVRPVAIKEFLSVAKKIYDRGLKPIPARLSTLIDPFQPAEEQKRATLRILKIALKYEYPLIINTKSILPLENPWNKVIVSLADRGLVILQYSISLMSNDKAQIIEPLAPSVEERLNAMKTLSEQGVPIVLRLSPYIPGRSMSPYGLQEFTGLLRDIGVKHVIVETIRFTQPELNVILNKLDVKTCPLEQYSLRVIEGGRPLYKPHRDYVYNEYLKLKEELDKRGIGFATCKEGFFSLHNRPDCCGFYLFKVDVAKRITLYEYYLEALSKPIALDKIEEIHEDICRRGYICSNNMNDYPRRIKKPFRNHEAKLLKILRSRQHLRHVAPELDIVEDKIVVRRVSV